MSKPLSLCLLLTVAVFSISQVWSHEPAEGIKVEVLAKSENSWMASRCLILLRNKPKSRYYESPLHQKQHYQYINTR